MTIKQTPKKSAAIHFPTSRERGAFPFPTSRSVAQSRGDESGGDQSEQLSEEELRLMADTMPGEGPGD
jgi:hypothetical protein